MFQRQWLKCLGLEGTASPDPQCSLPSCPGPRVNPPGLSTSAPAMPHQGQFPGLHSPALPGNGPCGAGLVDARCPRAETALVSPGWDGRVASMGSMFCCQPWGTCGPLCSLKESILYCTIIINSIMPGFFSPYNIKF